MNMRYDHTLLTALAAALFLTSVAHAQDAKKSPSPTPSLPGAGPAVASTGDSLDQTMEKFFGFLGKGQIDEAYNYLTKGTKIGDDLEEMAKLKVNTKEAIQKFGDIKGYELVTIQPAGTHLIRATYLSLGAAYPLRWKFYFYRLDKTWNLIDIGVDDRLVDIFDDNKVPQQPSGAAQ
jgi:hypothetical protein